MVESGVDVTFIAPSIRFGPRFRVAKGARLQATAQVMNCGDMVSLSVFDQVACGLSDLLR